MTLILEQPLVLSGAPAAGAAADQLPQAAQGAHIGRMLNRWDLLAGLLVAMTTTALAWCFRSAIVPIDPWDYVEGARNFPHGQWNLTGLSRWGMIAPNLLFVRLWGNSELTYYAWPILTTALLAATLFLLGCRLGNRVAGLAGASLLALPVFAVHATRGYPDMAGIALVGASLLLLILAADRAQSHGLDGWGVALVLAAGALCGWAFETRETTVFTWPALAVALLRIRHRPAVCIMAFSLPALGWLLADLWASAHYLGDPLIRFHAATGDLTTSVVGADAKYLGHTRGWYAVRPFAVLFARSSGPLLVGLIAIGLVGGALMWRRLWPTWLWGLGALLPLWWAGGAGNPAHPAIRLDIARYSLSFAIPLAMTGVLVVTALCQGQSSRRRTVGLAAAIGLLVAGAVPALRFAGTFPGFAPNGGTSLTALRTVLADQPDLKSSVVWSDWATQRLAPIYSTTPTGRTLWRAKQFRSLNRLIDRPSWEVPQWPAPGDIVIVHSPHDDTCYYCRKAYEQVTSVHRLPQPGWRLLYRSPTDNLEVYRIGPGTYWPR